MVADVRSVLRGENGMACALAPAGDLVCAVELSDLLDQIDRGND